MILLGHIKHPQIQCRISSKKWSFMLSCDLWPSPACLVDICEQVSTLHWVRITMTCSIPIGTITLESLIRQCISVQSYCTCIAMKEGGGPGVGPVRAERGILQIMLKPVVCMDWDNDICVCLRETMNTALYVWLLLFVLCCVWQLYIMASTRHLGNNVHP